MKKAILFFETVIFISIISASPANATTRTVCNFPEHVAQYNSLQEVINASDAGDTILIQGSSYSYGAATILDKKLTIIGPGWSPVRQMPPIKAYVVAIYIQGASSSGTEIQGLVITGDGGGVGISTQEGVSINYIRIIRNYFDIANIIISGVNGDTTSRYTIEGNYIFNSAISPANENYSFQNSVIQNNVFALSGFSNFRHCSNLLVNHNLFYRASIYGAFVNYCNGFTIQNNIFCKSDPSGANYTFNCTFKNNITFNTSATAAWTINGNADLGGNVLNQDPKMLAQSSVNSGVNDPLLNFMVGSPSPAKSTASDGKDMGLLYDATGRYNWNNSRTSRSPYVFKVDIPTNTIEPNTTLNVSIEARRNN